MIGIEKPTLILNPTVTRQNIARMAQKARSSGVRFRPHFKTHQSAAIGEWFKQEGVKAITVSSVDMAAYFAAHGWDDITIAFPLNWRQIDAINQLAAEIRLNVLVESAETVQFLKENLTSSVGVWLKIDTGLHRTGVQWDDFTLSQLAAGIAGSDKLRLQGLLTHSGHTYREQGKSAVEAVYQETVERMSTARQRLESAGFAGLDISIGDTPSCSLVDDLSAVDEIRPGNFVFYDMMQVQIGSCAAGDVAVAVACPVVARHPDRETVIVYGGAVHLSTDFLPSATGRNYGAIALPTADGWTDPVPDCYVQSVSQEHGVIRASRILLDEVKVGDVLMILPVHSCLTVNQFRAYRTPSGESLPLADIKTG
jgi:D-serine deaminase-like pyridoxal phosphate-dependent protein